MILFDFCVVMWDAVWYFCVTLPSQGKDGKKLELAQVIAPYEATSKEQLSLVQVSQKWITFQMMPMIFKGDNDSDQEENGNWMVAGRTGKPYKSTKRVPYFLDSPSLSQHPKKEKKITC